MSERIRRVSRLLRGPIALLLGAALVSCASPAGEYGNFTVVRFDYDEVTPASARVPSGGTVRWINIADDTRAFVILPDSMASSFDCKDLGPDFRASDDGYRSLPITPFASENVELPCALAPGSYSYSIWIEGAGLGQTTAGGPGRTLDATLVAE